MVIEILYLEIAGFNIGIRFNGFEYPYFKEKRVRDKIFQLFFGFIKINPKKIDFWVNFTNQTELEVIAKSGQKKFFLSFYTQSKINEITTYYHISEDQFQTILRKICHVLLQKNNGIMIHASSVLVNNYGYIFLGPSGAGKSTTMSFLSPKYQPLGDDSIIIKNENQKLLVFQTPFKEKNAWFLKSSNKYQLGKIFFIKKSKSYRIEQIEDREEILHGFSNQMLIEKEDFEKQFKRVTQIAKNHKYFYNLYFSLESKRKLIEVIENV